MRDKKDKETISGIICFNFILVFQRSNEERVKGCRCTIRTIVESGDSCRKFSSLGKRKKKKKKKSRNAIYGWPVFDYSPREWIETRLLTFLKSRGGSDKIVAGKIEKD